MVTTVTRMNTAATTVHYFEADGYRRGLAYARLGLANGQPLDITKGRVTPRNPGETAH